MDTRRSESVSAVIVLMREAVLGEFDGLCWTKALGFEPPVRGLVEVDGVSWNCFLVEPSRFGFSDCTAG